MGHVSGDCILKTLSAQNKILRTYHSTELLKIQNTMELDLARHLFLLFQCQIVNETPLHRTACPIHGGTSKESVFQDTLLIETICRIPRLCNRVILNFVLFLNYYTRPSVLPFFHFDFQFKIDIMQNFTSCSNALIVQAPAGSCSQAAVGKLVV